MKLNRREKKLLFTLILVIFIIVSYIFLIEPQRKNINELKEQVKDNEQRIEKIHTAKEKIIEYENEYDILSEQVEERLSGYFGKIEQEDIIILFDKLLNESNTTVDVISFSDFNQKDSDFITYYYMDVNLPINGRYTAIRDLLSNIEYYNDKIYIESLSIDSSGYDTNSLMKVFVSLKLIKFDADHASLNSLNEWVESVNDFSDNPFSKR